MHMRVDDNEPTVRPAGLAPTSSLTFFPCLKTANVGICESSQHSHLLKKPGTIAYSTDANLLRDRFLFIYIDLIKLDFSVVLSIFRQSLKDGRDNFAGATPRSPKVNNDDFARIDLYYRCNHQT